MATRKEIRHLNIKLNKYFNLVLILKIETTNDEIIVENPKMNILGIYDIEKYTFNSALKSYAEMVIEDLQNFAKKNILMEVLQSNGFEMLSGQDLQKSLDKQMKEMTEETKIRFEKEEKKGGYIAISEKAPINLFSQIYSKPIVQISI